MPDIRKSPPLTVRIRGEPGPRYDYSGPSFGIDGRIAIFVDHPGEWILYCNVTESFINDLRYAARIESKSYTPLEYLAANPETTDDELWKKVPMATTFRQTLAASIYKMFHTGDLPVIDLAGGWFDRATALGLNVVVVEPRAVLHERYQQMMYFFDINDRVTLIQGCAEEVPEYPRNGLVIFDPPYWTKENYCTEPTQSTIKFPTLELWVRHFIVEAVIRATKPLIVGGFLIIAMSDYGRTFYTDKVVRSIATHCPHLQFCGFIPVVKHGNAKSQQPLYIWRRI